MHRWITGDDRTPLGFLPVRTAQLEVVAVSRSIDRTDQEGDTSFHHIEDHCMEVIRAFQPTFLSFRVVAPSPVLPNVRPSFLSVSMLAMAPEVFQGGPGKTQVVVCVDSVPEFVFLSDMPQKDLPKLVIVLNRAGGGLPSTCEDDVLRQLTGQLVKAAKARPPSVNKRSSWPEFDKPVELRVEEADQILMEQALGESDLRWEGRVCVVASTPVGSEDWDAPAKSLGYLVSADVGPDPLIGTASLQAEFDYPDTDKDFTIISTALPRQMRPKSALVARREWISGI